MKLLLILVQISLVIQNWVSYVCYCCLKHCPTWLLIDGQWHMGHRNYPLSARFIAQQKLVTMVISKLKMEINTTKSRDGNILSATDYLWENSIHLIQRQ